jgi:hypothetical protein
VIILLLGVSNHSFNSFYHKGDLVKVGVADVADCIKDPIDVVEISTKSLKLLFVFVV